MRKRVNAAYWVLLCLGLLALCGSLTPLMCQGITGTIYGLVTDSMGAVVPGAEVRAINVGTGEKRVATTDATGRYLFTALPSGEYRVELEVGGFKKFVREGLRLSVNQNARVDVSLQLGEITQSVEVKGDAMMVDTREVQVGGLVDSQRVNDLPLNGRNVYSLSSILPGVTTGRFLTTPDNFANSMTVNGSRSRQSTFMLDGGFNNDLIFNTGNAAPNPDAVAEFRIISSNSSAEFGRSPGAVINVVTKSGTNQLHMTAFEFLRNNVLNARNYFQPTVSPLRQNQYGLSGGGPIIKNKTFFFGSFQGLKVRVGAFVNSALPPTAAERKGDFSAAPANQRPVDPKTNQLFPGGLIPVSRLDPVASRMLELLVPLPNTPDGRLELSTPRTSDQNEWLGKIDHQLSAMHKLSGSLFVMQSDSLDPSCCGSNIPGVSALEQGFHQRNLVVNEDWTVSPKILNQARFSFTRRLWLTSKPVRTTWSDFGSQLVLGSEPGSPPHLFVNGRWQMGSCCELSFKNQSYGWSDTLNWMRGKHSLKIGTTLLYHKYDEVTNWLGMGQVRFNGGFTKNSAADFMLGQAASFRQNNAPIRHFRSKNWHSFIQDDWKISRKVTLNLGMRYELNTPYVATDDKVVAFRYGVPSQVIPKAPLGMQFVGDPGISRGTIPTDWNNFGPRLGLAIDVFGTGRTAIRAGYGIYYAADAETFANSLQGQPFNVDMTIFGTPNLVNPWGDVPGGSPFPFKLDPANPRFFLPITVNYNSENRATPYIQQYNVAVEQQLMQNLSLNVSYVGNNSRKLSSQRESNIPVFIPGKSTTGNVDARRPYMPGVFGQIPQMETAANGHYDSMQVTLNRRFAKGFSILGSYTLGKSIDEIPDDSTSNTQIFLVDSNNRRLERAASNSDVRHVFTLSYMWDLPPINRWGFVGQQIMSGWQLNGITRIDSGFAFNVVSGKDTNLDGNTNDRPNLVGDPFLSTSRSRSELISKYFNTDAFQTPADGAVGTAGRNILYGPGGMNFDVSFFKNIRIKERHRLQFRSEFFNFFNQVNLGTPNTTLSNRNFGRILNAGSARVVQFGLKYMF